MPTKVCLVNAMVFPVVMFAVSWTARRSKPVYPKGNQSWIFIGRADAEAENPILWPRTDSFEKALMLWKIEMGGEGDNRGWDSWMASLTWQIWVWTSSRNWWWIGKPGVLLSMGSQGVRHDWVTELNWTKDNMSRKKYVNSLIYFK